MEASRDTVVVVPMFNEARVIRPIVSELLSVFRRVIAVDDGSTDDSARMAAAAGADVVRHAVNLGQGAALQTGIEYALLDPGVRFIVTFDADGQHRTQDAVRMLSVGRLGDYDAVLGSRFLNAPPPDMPRLRRYVLKAAVHFTRFTSGLRVTDTHNGLRVLSRRAANEIHLTVSGMAHASEILNQIASSQLKYCEHPTTIAYTEYSRSKGQRNINAINILFDVLALRLRGQR